MTTFQSLFTRDGDPFMPFPENAPRIDDLTSMSPQDIAALPIELLAVLPGESHEGPIGPESRIWDSGGLKILRKIDGFRSNMPSVPPLGMHWMAALHVKSAHAIPLISRVAGGVVFL